MTNRESSSDADVANVATSSIASDRYQIVATATIEGPANEVWAVLRDWERFLEVTLPKMTSDFEWVEGGPGQAPSTLRFAVGDSLLDEEIYEMSADEEQGAYLLRYRLLEPALGLREYDAAVELDEVSDDRTAFKAIRQVRFEPGADPGGLVGMIETETRRLQEHFASGAS